MLRREILDIIDQLNADIPDFYQVHQGLQNSIAYWVEDDRKAYRKKGFRQGVHEERKNRTYADQ